MPALALTEEGVRKMPKAVVVKALIDRGEQTDERTTRKVGELMQCSFKGSRPTLQTEHAGLTCPCRCPLTSSSRRSWRLARKL